MTQEQQRIAIAEACGWIDCEHIESLGFCLGKHKEGRVQYDSGHSVLPDYLNDLNAMHEAEKILTEVQFGDYYIEHLKMARGESQYTIDRSMVCATPRQRAEAFLRTIDKWTSNQPTE